MKMKKKMKSPCSQRYGRSGVSFFAAGIAAPGSAGSAARVQKIAAPPPSSASPA
jgi:hypothetical protein